MRCSSSAARTTSAAACRRTTRRPRAFRARVDAQLAARPPLDRHALAVDGDDLIAGLGLAPGPRLGRMLDALLERVIDDPALNDRATLLLLAQGMLADMPGDEVDA